MDPYQDRSTPIEDRVDDLLSRMTVTEKVGQLNHRLRGWQAYDKQGEHRYGMSKSLIDEVERWGGIGFVYGLFRADPVSGVTWASGVFPEDCWAIAQEIQAYVTEHSRLHIPVLFSEECPHGHQGLGATIFPSNLGMASSWNPELYSAVFRAVAGELGERGVRLGWVGTVDVLREPRWGR